MLTLRLSGIELEIALASFSACVAILLLWLNYGASAKLVAHPNDRSSHQQVTPTGGGVVIVVIMAAVLCVYFFQGVTWAGWLAVGGLGVATIGLIDDVRELSARLRLGLHVVVVGLLVWSADAVGQSQAGWPGELPDWLVATLWVAAVVWFLNLFNFMDGIDGLATLQSGSYCLAALLFMLGDAGWYAGVLWSGVACSLGFAVFNIAPARIFMGDAGSAFWGLLLGFLVLQLAIANALPLVASLILLSAFWFDATYTLMVRIATGQRFTHAHRSHLYQRLADRLGHGRTTGLYLALFLLWQWPLTAWVRAIYLANSSSGSFDTADAATVTGADHWADLAGAGLALNLWWIVVLACVPIAFGCVFLRAGQSGQVSGPGRDSDGDL